MRMLKNERDFLMQCTMEQYKDQKRSDIEMKNDFYIRKRKNK